jgi:preprotein translocase subunit YajC
MVDSLAKGDEIITNGGLLGKVTNLGENFVVVELAPNIEVKLQRHAIATVVPKGTLKTL